MREARHSYRYFSTCTGSRLRACLSIHILYRQLFWDISDIHPAFLDCIYHIGRTPMGASTTCRFLQVTRRTLLRLAMPYAYSGGPSASVSYIFHVATVGSALLILNANL
jgi:hypothetical protein